MGDIGGIDMKKYIAIHNYSGGSKIPEQLNDILKNVNDAVKCVREMRKELEEA